MNRRTFVGAAVGVALSNAAPAATYPIIDTHIHLFDPTRPQGVPWPPKENKVLYKTALPDRYSKLAVPVGVVGAIEVECSPWLEDNQWVLDVMAKNKIMVGMIGNLEPASPDFRKNLDRFHRNPLFLGIRYGNLWGNDLSTQLAKPEFIAGIKALADAGLTLDSANPDTKLITALLRLTDKVPNLRLVVDHVPQMDPSTSPDLKEFSKRKQAFVKISEVLRKVDGRVPLDVNFYRARIDNLFGIFGEDRVVYGSDWPNSDGWAEYPKVFSVVHDYFTAKGPAIAEKYFYKNSIAAYHWVKRT